MPGGKGPTLEQVYLAYVDEVESLVRRFLTLDSRSRTAGTQIDVGDLVQEVIMRAFGEKARASFDGTRNGPFPGALTRNLLTTGHDRRAARSPWTTGPASCRPQREAYRPWVVDL
jgi:DNA-directed RNA polymerase specialized sigma24 family protein